MLLQWIFPFEGQCPCHTWNESLPFMLHKNNINIHEHLRFNHVMSLVYKIPTPYYLWVLLSQTKLFCFYVSVDLLDFSECLWPRWAVEALCRSTWCWEQLLKWWATSTGVADVAEIGAARNWCSFSELCSAQGSKVRLRALFCRTENSRETFSPI